MIRGMINFSDYISKNYNNEELKKGFKNKDFKDLLIGEGSWFLAPKKEEKRDKESYPNLRKWIRYRSLNEDVDKVLKTPGKKLDIVQVLGWYDNSTDMRYLDCIFSLKTHLNMFLRLYEPAGVNHLWLLENMDFVFSDERIKEFSNKHNIDTSIVKGCIEGLEFLAKNTNTIGNYMPCPDNQYNKIKGNGRGKTFMIELKFF